MTKPFEHKEKSLFERAYTITTSCASGAILGTAVTPVIGTLAGAVTGAIVGNIVYVYRKKEDEKQEARASDTTKENNDG